MATRDATDKLINVFLAGDTSVLPVLQDAFEEGVVGTGKARYLLLKPKREAFDNSTRFAIVVPGKAIRIFGGFSDVRYDRSLVIGSPARYFPTYRSFNLIYWGGIESITVKSVDIKKDDSGKSDRRRLNLYDFSRENERFDVDASERKNREYLQYC
jgi:hypothetical protein